MASLPANVSTGLVTGRFIVGVVDGSDADLEPEAVPASGIITFSASVPYLPNPTASPDPVTILKIAIVATLDDEGYVTSPDGNRGVRLVATDDPDLLVEDWTWDVIYKFDRINGTLPYIPPHGLLVPSGSTVDLTTAIKVPSSPGVGKNQLEAYTLRAESLQAQSLDLLGSLMDAVEQMENAVGLISNASVIRLDEDGTPYYDPALATPAGFLDLDTDGVPYITIGD